MYEYIAEVIRVVDGDTAELKIDLGFRMYMVANCRFYRVDTPELKKEPERALAAKQFTESHLPVGAKVRISSKRLDKYGRPEVTIYIGDTTLNALLKLAGHIK